MSIFTHQRRIGFGDCDPAGIVFYPRYFEMFNETVETWFRDELGHGFLDLHLKQAKAVPTVKAEVEFRASSRLEDLLELALVVEHIGGRSARLRIEVSCAGEARVTALLTLVYIDAAAHKAEAWPADLRAAMTPYLEAA
jgi:4-hydroxybenzoyl-CoA thioesterase